MFFSYLIHQGSSSKEMPKYPFVGYPSYSCNQYLNTFTFAMNNCSAGEDHVTSDGVCFTGNMPNCSDSDPTQCIINLWGYPLTHSEYMQYQSISSLTDLYNEKKENEEVTQPMTQFIANKCSWAHYSNSEFCSSFSSSSILQQWEYPYWPQNNPFINYGNSALYNIIIDSDDISTSFRYRQTLIFYLATYRPNGTFVGMKPLSDQLQMCHDLNKFSQAWRSYGFNYDISCDLNLSFLDSVDNNLFDIFFYEEKDKQGYLRPIPILNRNMENMKDAKLDSSARFVRRMFLKDNMSDLESITYLRNVKIVIQQKKSKRRNILVPYLDISYGTVSRENLAKSTKTDTFTFEVQYTYNLEDFWQTCIIIFSVLAVLIFVFWVIRSFFYFKSNSDDLGGNGTVFISVASLFFDYFGNLLWFIIFIFGCYIFIFFKGQRSVYYNLPPSAEFDKIIIPFMWISFSFKFIAVLLQIIVQNNYDMYIVDWETSREGSPVSAWRKIHVASEWTKTVTVRSYSMKFTLFALALILDGFGVKFISNPNPLSKLWDMHSSSPILRFTFDVFMWIGLFILQYLFKNGLYWRVFGSPYYTFLDLCTTSNLSVFLFVSGYHGFYLHGRSAHQHADEDMKKLVRQLADEANGIVANRGLQTGGKIQVFEVFLSRDFRNQFRNISSRAQMPKVSFSLKRNRASDISPNVLTEYNQMNTFLRKFIIGSQEGLKYTIQPESFMQSFLGYGPNVADISIFTEEEDDKFKQIMMWGIEITLYLFYMVAFICLDVSTNSPCIAAFTVFLFDFLLVRLFKILAKVNVSRKSLLDDRFIQ